ncbi:hypothetical protein [Haemophilus influenzae]|uniref:hypothetical protein n=1 Tax=Haemophilus influenzae TaxID=727 RepID=UPI000570A464|nr:hypothetical protein [Haemophilus influenzae]MCK9065307.1 hypothetical protein [Haemophilus influenzae]BBE95141.1 hypothetical protein CHBNII8_12410 [Haemophilus influenzae]GBK77302.1 hypothetical protein NTHiID7_12850 [Haemophilus influenzae]
MLGTVFCYFIAISFGIAMPIILVKISLLEDEAKVIELEQKLQRLENKYKAEQELKLATLEKNLLRKEYVTSEQCVP